MIRSYLDLKKATVNAICDYKSMQFIIDNTSDEIKSKYIKMMGISSPSYTDLPKIKDSRSPTEKMNDALADIDLLKERYKQAVEYMAWFVPCWEELSDDERYILDTFYLNEDTKTEAVYCICDYFGIERSSAYRYKDKALEHLSTLLYGK